MSLIKVNKDTVKERIEIIQARLENASEGPWRADKTLSGAYSITNNNGLDICDVLPGYLKVREHNANFIEHSRDDIEWLLKELKKSRQGQGGF